MFSALNSFEVPGSGSRIGTLFTLFRGNSLQEHAEADAFFCFVELLSDFRDHFCQQLDNSEVGIRSTITRMNNLLKAHDEELWLHLNVRLQVC